MASEVSEVSRAAVAEASSFSEICHGNRATAQNRSMLAIHGSQFSAPALVAASSSFASSASSSDSAACPLCLRLRGMSRGNGKFPRNAACICGHPRKTARSSSRGWWCRVAVSDVKKCRTPPVFSEAPSPPLTTLQPGTGTLQKPLAGSVKTSIRKACAATRASV